ncbi:peptidylprolyl isomerase [Sulfurifustis variabilis]|uniref:peptidylprolyl isomerase n=1 Tax=Sulfurifustis variabilis TaxID=1675686 RepID=A0A1B4V2I7_9GAMM|nr:peptidylprolyl isomerase [Sulfurifustis variabilis]BAU47758.1 peptidylprolyl isomerase [Sulfurifustis variabilis]
MSLRTATVALALVAGLVALAACERQADTIDDSKVLATVNGQPITETELEQYRQLRQAREPIADKAKEREVVLKEMIDRVLLAQKAEANGLDKDPEVQALLKRVRENILVQAMIRRNLKDNPITDDELKTRFDKEVRDTHKTEYQVRHILVKDEDEARDIIKQLKGKGSFENLAKKHSIDVQSGKNGGSLGWINQGMVVPEFFEGVSRLEKGAVSSEPVKSDFGWHVIKVENTRAAKIPTFEEFMGDRQARANFQRRLQDEHVEQMVKELRASAKITTSE